MPNLIAERRLILRPQAFQSLEQWFAADSNVVTSSGVADSITSIGNGSRYRFSATDAARPTVAVDADGFAYLGFDGSTQRFTTISATMKDFGVEPTGLEWHGVMSFSSAAARYLMTVDAATGENRYSVRLYRSNATTLVGYTEPGGTGSQATITLTYGSGRAVFSAYRSTSGTTIAVGINGVFGLSTNVDAAAVFNRRVFNWYNPGLNNFLNGNFYESMGFVTTLTESERQNVINYLRNKYRIS